jgi:Tfp pilus assembly protein PilV
VVILAFVVLLTVLVLAYFSYSALQRQISSASSNQAAAEIFAQGAINTIVSDFKQEIFDGSTNSTYGTNTVSIPKAATNAAPFLVGTSTNLPNLLKRSASGLPFSPGGAARASAVSSTNASQNGRSISPARWNAALLLPKANTNSTTDLTP